MYEIANEASTPSLGALADTPSADIESLRQRLFQRIQNYFERSTVEETSKSLEKSLGFRDSILLEEQKQSAVSLEVSIKQFIRAHPHVNSGPLH
jgi:hypothetical protein